MTARTQDDLRWHRQFSPEARADSAVLLAGVLSKVQSVQAPPGLPPCSAPRRAARQPPRKKGKRDTIACSASSSASCPGTSPTRRSGCTAASAASGASSTRQWSTLAGLPESRSQALRNGKKRHGCKCQQRLGCPESSRTVYVEDPPRLFLWERARQEWATRIRSCKETTSPRGGVQREVYCPGPAHMTRLREFPDRSADRWPPSSAEVDALSWRGSLHQPRRGQPKGNQLT